MPPARIRHGDEPHDGSTNRIDDDGGVRAALCIDNMGIGIAIGRTPRPSAMRNLLAHPFDDLTPQVCDLELALHQQKAPEQPPLRRADVERWHVGDTDLNANGHQLARCEQGFSCITAEAVRLMKDQHFHAPGPRVSQHALVVVPVGASPRQDIDVDGDDRRRISTGGVIGAVVPLLCG